MNGRFQRTELIVTLLFFFSGLGMAQVGTTFAQLTGTIEDQTGGVVPDAALSLKNLATNQTYSSQSNRVGLYAFANLNAGEYELTASAIGFARYTQQGVILKVGQTATLNLTFQIAGHEESLNVTAEAPVIETTKTEVSQVIDTKQIETLPTMGRLFTDFALLTPGVSTGRSSLGSTLTEFEITRISFGGMRDFSNEITVDGADNVNTVTASQRSTPPQESVEEFRVVNNSFGAEYGRALGGIVNIVTKSGTNDFHGSLYEYLQNNATNARSLLQPAPDPYTLRQNQFGLAAGGPIRKNKTFFFTNYEGQRRAGSPTYPPVLASNLNLINRAKAYLGLAPENLNVLKTADHDYGIAKLDQQLNENNRFSLRYNIENANDLNQLVGSTLDGGGIATPSGGRNLSVLDQSLSGTLNSVLKPNLVNSALVQWAQRSYKFPGATGQPDLSIPNTLEFGHNFGAFDAIDETREQLSDSVAWVHENHIRKFGLDLNFLQDQTVLPAFTPERIIMPALNCLVDFANFVDAGSLPALAYVPNSVPGGGPCPLPPIFDGVAAVQYGNIVPRTGFTNGFVPPSVSPSWQNAFPPAYRDNFQVKINHQYYGLFAHDQWRVTSKLTLNYGLRYDLESGLDKFIRMDPRGLQPRVGFAYSPDGKTVVRSGFGLFDDRYNLAFFFVTGNEGPLQIPGVSYPFFQTKNGGAVYNQINSPGWVPAAGNTANFTLNASAGAAKSILSGMYPPQYLYGPCPPSCTGGAGGIDPNSRIPYSEQASFEIDRQLGKGLSLSVGYLWVAAHHLIRGNNLNVSCPVGTSKPGNPATAQGFLNPNGTLSNCEGSPTLLFGKPYFSNAIAGAEFAEAGLIDYNNGIANASHNALTLQFAERLGSFFNLSGNYTYSHTIDDGTFTTYVSLPQNAFDIPAERANSNQDVRNRFVTSFTARTPSKGILRNIELSGIVTAQSGRPFTLFVGADANGDTNPVTDRVGTVGRNTYTGDGLYTVDLRVTRQFEIREGLRLLVSIDGFNTLNRPNVDEVTTVYGAPDFCGPTPIRYKDQASLTAGGTSCAGLTPTVQSGSAPVPPGAGIPPSPNSLFGTPRTVLNPRQLQFGAKLTF
jgi:hypothetical protein